MKDTLDTTSYWHRTAACEEYPALREDIETDNLIIGGGITGVTCAFNLGRKGCDTVLIEAARLCGGTTGNSTAKATIQHGVRYSKLMKKMGSEAAALYAEAQTQGLDFIKSVCKGNADACGFAENEAFLYASSDAEVEDVKKELRAAQELKIDCEFISNAAFPPDNKCMLGFKHQAVIHPVRYIDTLAQRAAKEHVRIYEHTKAIHIESGDIVRVTCENDVVIRAKHLILATQFPIYEGMGAFFARLYPTRDYGIAVKTTKEWPGDSYVNCGMPIRSVRTHIEHGERIMIVVGEGHYTARSANMEQHFDELMRFAGTTAGMSDLLAKWSAQDYDTPDELPFIGRISEKSNIYVATGFAKWGITNGTLAGIMIPELILRGESPYADLLSPHRLNLKVSAGKLLSEVGGSIKELVLSKFEPLDSVMDLERGQARIIPYHGKRAGAYMDDNGRLTIVDITCDHMGTELNWNSAERSWDCPAHGGRYRYDGQLLEGPPKSPLKILYQDKE